MPMAVNAAVTTMNDRVTIPRLPSADPATNVVSVGFVTAQPATTETAPTATMPSAASHRRRSRGRVAAYAAADPTASSAAMLTAIPSQRQTSSLTSGRTSRA